MARLTKQRDTATSAAQAAESAAQQGARDDVRRATYAQFGNPVDGPITSGFGARAAPTKGASTFHPALDYGVPVGTSVRAPAIGTVEAVGFDPKLGKFVIINHGAGTTSRYGHLSEVDVTVGQRLGQGETFARTGNTGLSTGPHLDYQVREGGKPVDPRKGRFKTDEFTSAAAAGRAQEAATSAARELEDFGQRASDSIARVSGEFDEQPRLIDRAAAATRQLDAVMADLAQRKPPGFAATIEQAQRAKQVVADGVDRPYRELIGRQGEQLANGRLILAGQQDQADALAIINGLERTRGPLGDAQRANILAGVVALKDQTAELERQSLLINGQVAAARRVQDAFTNLFQNPFAKGGLSGLGEALTKGRQQQIAEQLSIQLFGGDLGSRVHDALTRESAPLSDAGNLLQTAARDLSAAAAQQTRAANDNPSVSQLATTPTAFTNLLPGILPALTGAVAGEAGDIVAEGRRQSGPGLENVDLSAGRVIVPELQKLNLNAQKQTFLTRGQTIALSYAAQAIGGKGGAAVNALLNADQTFSLGKDIAKQLGGTGKLGFAGGGGLAGAAGGAVAGLGIGSATASLYSLLGVKGAGTGAQVGGAIGGAAFGPLGAIGGSVLGGLIGAAFYKPKYGTAAVSNGGIGVAGNSSAAMSGANSLAGALQQGIQSIVDQLGGKLGNYNVSIGTFDGKYRVSTTGFGGSLDSKKAKGQGLVDFGKDGQDAAIRYAIVDAIQDGAVQGLRNGTVNLLRAGMDLDRQLQKALSFEGVFTELKQLKDPIGAANDAIDKQLTALRATFSEAGATAEENAQLEELYALKRADAVKQAQEQVTGQLKSLLDDLKYKGDSGLSLRTRESSAFAALSPLIAQIQAGKSVDQGAFADAARSYLDIERQLYGSTNPYFEALSKITGLTNQAITNTGAGSNVLPFSDSVSKAAQAASDAAIASLTTFTIPEDRVAMMTSGQFSEAVRAGMSGVVDTLFTEFRLQTAQLVRAGQSPPASEVGGLAFPLALRNA